MTPANTPLPGALRLEAADLRGLSRLGFDATVGLADLVEAMHHTIASRAGIVGPAPAGRTGGITGLVYGAVRGSTRALGRATDLALGLLPTDEAPQRTPVREAMVAAINGLWGDHLADSGNPLAIPMCLRLHGRALGPTGPAASQLAGSGGKLVVLLHGLCMNDLQWERRGHDHGRMLQSESGYTPLTLHYNSGRHVSQNGRDFAALLERTLRDWPVPVERLAIVGHSMGGLVARSACAHAARTKLSWLGALDDMVFLGTPHHGAPLERGGRLVDTVLQISPYVAPFARLGKSRSAGITDLRFGNLLDADWQARDRHAQRRDDRQPVPLPAGVRSYLLAATTAEQDGGVHGALIGDGLVPLPSALGRHRRSQLALAVPEGRQHVVHGCGHLDLLCHDEVAAQLRRWLG